MQVTAHWLEGDFEDAVKSIEKAPVSADITISDIEALKNVLMEKKCVILSMVENPSLLEHDRFTEMLWAVYHMEQELNARDGFTSLPRADYDHMTGDLKRAYRHLCLEWLYFNRYLKQKYPYLFSLAVRKSPFHAGSIIIHD